MSATKRPLTYSHDRWGPITPRTRRALRQTQQDATSPVFSAEDLNQDPGGAFGPRHRPGADQSSLIGGIILGELSSARSTFRGALLLNNPDIAVARRRGE